MYRILHIISDSNIGGAGRYVLHYARCANRGQFSILAAVPRGSQLAEPLRKEDVTVHEMDGIADRTYKREDVTSLKALIQDVKPDLVHTHGAFSGRLAARMCHVPVVSTRHSVFPVPGYLHYPPGRWINGIVNRMTANRIIAVNPAAESNLTDAGISPRQITVILNGTEPVPRLPEAERMALRKELGLKSGVLVFGILTRIEDYKGHIYLLQAAKRLKERGISNFRILIAGTGSLEKELSREIIIGGLKDIVTLLGFRSDIDALLNILDVQLNTSYGTEATNLALLEGMSLGLPTIASNYGGTPFVVEDEVTGLLFPSQDVDALADCMARLIQNPDLMQTLGRNAQKSFETRFKGSIFAKSLENVYTEIIEKGTKA